MAHLFTLTYMIIELAPKLSLNEFIRTCTPLASILPLEDRFEQRVADLIDAVTHFEPSEEEISTLIQFLRADRDFLGIIVTAAPVSHYKFSESRNLVFALALNPSPSGRGTSKARFSPLLHEGEGQGGEG